VTPALTAQSINGDRERGTLATLQVTRLRPADIALGKLAAGWQREPLHPVHEHVIAQGPIGRLEGDLLHASAESIERYIAKQNRYTTLQADALHASGKRSSGWKMAMAPMPRFFRFYVLKLGFLDGAAGFAHIAIGAFASFLKHAKLRALDRAARNG